MNRTKLAFAFLALAAAGLAGCTDAQVTAAVNGACAAAVAGTTVYVQVESQTGGATAQNISKEVQSDTGADCPAVAAAASAAASAINASGGTATVTVSTSTPATATTAVKAKHVVGVFKLKRGVVAGQTTVIVVKPLTESIPGISELVNALGKL